MILGNHLRTASKVRTPSGPSWSGWLKSTPYVFETSFRTKKESGSKVHGTYEARPILAVFSVRKPSDPQNLFCSCEFALVHPRTTLSKYSPRSHPVFLIAVGASN